MRAEARRALVTGATGFVGRALVDRLLADGHDVTALTRRSEPGFSPAVHVIRADLARGRGVASRSLDHIDWVFHCAGVIGRTDSMRAVHVDGTRHLLASMPAGRPVRWVQLSSVGAYGPAAWPGAARTVDETTPEKPRGDYEITKTESDRLIQKAASAGQLVATILRPSAIVGARMPNASLRGLIDAIDRGWYCHVGPPGSLAHYVHVDDVVEALVRSATEAAAVHETFNLSSDCTWDALIAWIAARLGRPAPRLRVPALAVRGLAAVARLASHAPLTSSAVDALISRTAYPTTKIESALAFRLSRPMPSAIDELLENR